MDTSQLPDRTVFAVIKFRSAYSGSFPWRVTVYMKRDSENLEVGGETTGTLWGAKWAARKIFRRYRRRLRYAGKDTVYMILGRLQ